MTIVIISHFLINQSVKTEFIKKTIERGNQNINYTTLIASLGYDRLKVQKYFLSHFQGKHGTCQLKTHGEINAHYNEHLQNQKVSKS